MPEATVREIDGQLVLDDPQARAVIKAIGLHNCKATSDLNLERITYFTERARNLPLGTVVIVILSMDDPIGSLLGDALMPGTNWDAYRAEGQVPFARGLAGRDGVVDFMAKYDVEAVATLEALGHPQQDPFIVPVIVIDHGVIAVFPSNLYG